MDSTSPPWVCTLSFYLRKFETALHGTRTNDRKIWVWTSWLLSFLPFFIVTSFLFFHMDCAIGNCAIIQCAMATQIGASEEIGMILKLEIKFDLFVLRLERQFCDFQFCTGWWHLLWYGVSVKLCVLHFAVKQFDDFMCFCEHHVWNARSSHDMDKGATNQQHHCLSTIDGRINNKKKNVLLLPA